MKRTESVEKFLKKRASSLPHHEFISDALCIISARRLTVNPTQSAINDYYTLADQIIQAPSSEANTFNQKRKKSNNVTASQILMWLVRA